MNKDVFIIAHSVLLFCYNYKKRLENKLIIQLPDLNGKEVEVKVDKESLQKYFTNLLTRNDTAEPRWFMCAFCSKIGFFPLESDDFMLCNKCWKSELGEEK